jgi:hypothetical protein
MKVHRERLDPLATTRGFLVGFVTGVLSWTLLALLLLWLGV